MPKNIRKYMEFEGMHCRSCEALIKDAVSGIAGVKKIHADYATQKGYVVYDKTKADIKKIIKTIESKGYSVRILDDAHDSSKASGEPSGKKARYRSILGFSAVILGIMTLFFIIGKIYGMFGNYDITSSMSYGLIFVVGLITGFHCIAMCGGFVVSYVAKNSSMNEGTGYKSHLLYGSGKVLSYTAIGAIFGLLGGFIAFTPALRATIGAAAGLFLIVFGLNMLNIFPFLRRFQIRMPALITGRLNAGNRKNTGPFVTGLLNGLMVVCGPLQAMYILAAGTGSMLEGAKVMFIFGLGTLPLLLGFGMVAGRVSEKAMRSILRYSGVLVIILGLIMINRALILSGTGYDAASIASMILPSSFGGAKNPGENAGDYQIIHMNVSRSGYEPNKFFLKKGVPVKWIINSGEVSSCDMGLIVPEYNLTVKIVPGEQTVEFTPTKSGVVPWSCWMGMLRGSFVVSD